MSYGHAGDGTNHGQYGVPLEDEEASLAAWHADQDAQRARWETRLAPDTSGSYADGLELPQLPNLRPYAYTAAAAIAAALIIRRALR